MSTVRRAWRVVFLSWFAATAMAGQALAAGNGPVRIGIVPSQGMKVLLEQYQPLMDYLASRIGRPFELVPTKTYEEIVDRLKAGELDGAVLGSFTANKAIRSISAVLLARPEKGGVSTYRGFVIVRKDAGFRTIEDLKGKSFDFVSTGTSAGYVFPRALLKEKKADPGTFFSRTTYAQKHDIALAKVLNHESDGATVKDTVFDKLARSDPRVNAELTVIHKSDRFPDSTVLLRKETPPELVKSVRRVLLGMEKDPAARPALASIGADRYIETGAKDFAYLNKLVKEAGLK